MVREQLQKVQERMEAACRRAGRDPKEVTLIAVSKIGRASCRERV